VPPHLVAKAAAALGRDAFERVHRALLHAYFAENRDVSSPATLREIWREVGLPEHELARADDPELLKRVYEEHNQAIELGVGGVPAMQMEGNDAAITGAHPAELYRRWIQKRLEEDAR
jgi:predicted DsbA family dithiol-disulfide isomerase